MRRLITRFTACLIAIIIAFPYPVFAANVKPEFTYEPKYTVKQYEIDNGDFYGSDARAGEKYYEAKDLVHLYSNCAWYIDRWKEPGTYGDEHCTAKVNLSCGTLFKYGEHHGYSSGRSCKLYYITPSPTITSIAQNSNRSIGCGGYYRPNGYATRVDASFEGWWHSYQWHDSTSTEGSESYSTYNDIYIKVIHTPSPTWKYDASKHWRECTGCGAKTSIFV